MGVSDKQFCPACFQEFYLAHCPIGRKRKTTQPPVPVQSMQHSSAASGATSGQSAADSSDVTQSQTSVGNLPLYTGMLPESGNPPPPAPGGAPAPNQTPNAANPLKQEPPDYEILEKGVQPLFEKPPAKGYVQAPDLPLPIHKPNLLQRRVDRLDRKYQRMGAKRLCPHCHYALPDDYGFIDAYIIAVIGDRGSGKSLYFASLIKQFEEAQSGLHCLLEPADREISKLYKRYYESFIRGREIIPSTREAISREKEPFIFIWKANRGGAEAYFIFYDVAGQDYADLERVLEYHPQVEYANALIFLADPTHISGVQELLPDRLKPPARKDNDPIRQADHTLLFQLTEHIRRLRGQDTLSIPVAIMVPKSDVLEYAVDSQMKNGRAGKLSEELPITQQDVTYTALPSRKEFREINHEVRTFLQKREKGMLVEAANQLQLNARFFATSATSEIPDQDGKFSESMHPRRTLDPILWILGQLKLITIPAHKAVGEEEDEEDED